MVRNVQLATFAFDTATLTPGRREAIFFADRQGPDVDDAERSEAELVDWLVDGGGPFSLLVQVLCLPSSTVCARRVKKPFIAETEAKPGDIDLLFCAEGQPHQAVALEAKRVPVRSAGDGVQRVNRLPQLSKAATQANGLARIGFSRTYLGVIVIAHDLSDRSLNFVSRGTNERTFSDIVHTVERRGLEEGVGIVYVEIVQPQPDSIDTSAVVSAAVLRTARPTPQSHDLTNTVERYFETRWRGT